MYTCTFLLLCLPKALRYLLTVYVYKHVCMVGNASISANRRICGFTHIQVCCVRKGLKFALKIKLCFKTRQPMISNLAHFFGTKLLITQKRLQAIWEKAVGRKCAKSKAMVYWSFFRELRWHRKLWKRTHKEVKFMCNFVRNLATLIAI